MRQESYPSLGFGMAAPIDLKASQDGKHFFVLNSDFDRRFNAGSILTLDETGGKVGVVATQRLGRSLSYADQRLLATFDAPDEDAAAAVELYDAANPQNLQLKMRWEIGCSPINGVLAKSYNYFAVSCLSGDFFIGNLNDLSLKKVRSYGFPRRALWIDTTRQLVFMFPTDMAEQNLRDAIMQDKETYSDKGEMTAATNDIPDDYENRAQYRLNRSIRQKYQFNIYDIAAEASATPEAFPDRELRSDTVTKEQRFIYFTLNNFDGTPDPINAGVTDLTQKAYRTNFWHAEGDPLSTDSFYVSQRAHGDSKTAGVVTGNHVIRVRIKGDVRATTTIPKTEDVLEFERVYGFKGEFPDDGRLAFPGYFELKSINGQMTLLVNHFRDLRFWPRTQSYFSIAAKTLDATPWLSELSTQDAYTSYYHFSANERGRVAVAGFYANLVILLDVVPGVGINEVKRID